MHFMLRPNDFSIRCYPFFNCRMCFSIRLINAKNPHYCGLFLSFTIKKCGYMFCSLCWSIFVIIISYSYLYDLDFRCKGTMIC